MAMLPLQPLERPRRRLKTSTLLWLAGGLLVVSSPTLGRWYTDYLWFDSIGFRQVFVSSFLTKLGLGLGFGVVTAALLAFNLQLAHRLPPGVTSPWWDELAQTYRLDLPRIPLWRLLLPIAVVGGILVGLWAASLWDVLLPWLHGRRSGSVDPLLGYDLSFYFFTYPLLQSLRTLLLSLLLACLFGSALIYLSRGSLAIVNRHVQATPGARMHLTILCVLLFLLLALDAWLATASLVFSQRGPVVGASYADIEAKLPALRLQIAAALAGAVLALAHLFTQRNLLLLALLLYSGIEIVGVRAYPAMVQHFRVVPNEAVKEATLLRRNIQHTRRAFGLDRVIERHLSGETGLDGEDIARNRATLDNIRLWDHQPLLDTFAQIQEIRTYYEFVSVDNDRYLIDGELTQIMLSPRELSAASLPNRTWINEHFTFTHGYGLTLGPVDRATPEGLPVLHIRDIPPVSTTSLRITQPAIYFGELAQQDVFVHTRNREFDYPAGESNVYAEYHGDDGVAIGTPLARTALAVRDNSLKLLLSDDIKVDSRVLLYRNIGARVRRIAPFLAYDRDPYMVIREDGSLAWIQDAYTSSEHYPFAEPARIAGNVNYIRNSVKIVIDAYHGSTTFYLADVKDPIVRAWQRAFPQLFKPLASMPRDLRWHLRYPEDLFRIQTELFTTYHMERPELVYNREDQWEVPSITKGEQSAPLEPYYTVMKLPGEKSPEFIQMLPFSPKSKDNLAAWMAVRMDEPRRGELIVYRFPKDRLVFGPKQILNRIQQDAEISRQISLWDQRGSEAVLGTLLVIPIEESLIYVCPLYLRSSSGRIPELKRVVVVHENRIAMEASLSDAVARVFGLELGKSAAKAAAKGDGRHATASPSSTPTKDSEAAENAARSAMSALPAAVRSQVQDLQQHFHEAIEAQRQGNWARYGEKLQAVEQGLQQLNPPSPEKR